MISISPKPLPDLLPCHTTTILTPTITYHLLLRAPALHINRHLHHATLVQTNRDFAPNALRIGVQTGAMDGLKGDVEGDVGAVMHQEEEEGISDAAIPDLGPTTFPQIYPLLPRLPQ